MSEHFMSMIIHEMRNALTVISSFANDLTMRDDLAEDVRTEAVVIRQNAMLVLRLLRDVLEARDPLIGFDMIPTTVDLHSVVRHAVKSLRHDIETKHIAWSLELSAERHVVWADADRLRQVLRNLISNAVKFTSAAGRIVIRSSNPEPGRIRLEVIDSGIGIDPECLPHLFDFHEQGSELPAAGRGGWEIGLPVSKAIIDAHRGRLSAWSAGTDRGATFVLELDIDRQGALAAREPSRGESINGDSTSTP
jgi:signal transduction histidine kinase